MKSMMARFDELITKKSSKAQLIKAKERFAKEYIQKDVNDEFVKDQESRVKSVEDRITNAEELMKF